MQFQLQATTVFGLAFDILRRQGPETKSGFVPAKHDLGVQKELFGDVRLAGFAALLNLNFADQLILIGGDEGRYKMEVPVINRAWAIGQMLVKDCSISPRRISSIASNSNTGGNIAAMKASIQRGGLKLADCAVVSNHYHLPRVAMDLAAADLPIPCYPAEAFYLLHLGQKEPLIQSLGGGPLAERIVEECQGIADKLLGKYKPKTDTPAKPS